MFDPYQYEIGIKKIFDEGEEYFQATVKEFPDLKIFSDSYDNAYQSMIDALATSAELLSEQNKAIPEPLDDIDDYSGRITLRMAKTLHRELVINARNEGVSLNQYVLTGVTHYAGYCAAKSKEAAAKWDVRVLGDRRAGSKVNIISERYDDYLHPLVVGDVEGGVSLIDFGSSSESPAFTVWPTSTMALYHAADKEDHFVKIPRK